MCIFVSALYKMRVHVLIIVSHPGVEVIIAQLKKAI